MDEFCKCMYQFLILIGSGPSTYKLLPSRMYKVEGGRLELIKPMCGEDNCMVGRIPDMLRDMFNTGGGLLLENFLEGGFSMAFDDDAGEYVPTDVKLYQLLTDLMREWHEDNVIGVRPCKHIDSMDLFRYMENVDADCLTSIATNFQQIDHNTLCDDDDKGSDYCIHRMLSLDTIFMERVKSKEQLVEDFKIEGDGPITPYPNDFFDDTSKGDERLVRARKITNISDVYESIKLITSEYYILTRPFDENMSYIHPINYINRGDILSECDKSNTNEANTLLLDILLRRLFELCLLSSDKFTGLTSVAYVEEKQA